MARKKASRRPRKAAKRRARARPSARRIARSAARKRPVRAKKKRVVARKVTKKRPPKASRQPARPSAVARPAGAARIERERRRLPDTERLEPTQAMADSRMIAAARAGHDELRAQLERHTETSPKLTAGDVDARWQDAYAVGDEAPGGDNPTPDQDRVDDIGRALGVQYQDNEELQGGDEITKRDQKRWELDPASSDDWPHKDEE